MARHRNVRGMNYEDDFLDEDDYHDGHSMEDNYCISPATAAQFTFNRERETDLSSYMGADKIPEEEEEESESDHDPMNDSSGLQQPKLNDIEQAQLFSCMEELRNILGDTIPDHILSQEIIKHKYNVEATANDLLNQQAAPKPQRQPRQRRNRSQDQIVKPTVILKEPPPKLSKPDDSIVATADAFSQLVVKPQKGPVLGFATPESSPAKKPKDSTSPSSLASTQATVNGATDEGENVPGAMAAADAVSQSDLLLTPKREMTPKSTGKSKIVDRVKLKEEYERRQGGKELINLVVIGHVDAGKSTLMGHVLYQLGNVNKKAMHKYETESKKLGKGSFAFAWVLDETEEERSRGVTMDIAQTRFETLKKTVTLLDAPGHKDFIPNMITGTAQADVAILVVNATRGEFETGFETGGQTREHALLARSLGVSQIIVAINKMDTVGWAQERFDDIVQKLGLFLKQVGFKDSDVSFVPCSGLQGDNLVQTVKEPRLSAWYSGATLVERIDKFKPVSRLTDSPFRLIVSDIFKGMGSGFSVTGRVAAGTVQTGERLLVMPSVDTATVKSIIMEDMSTNCAFAGDHVTLTITGVDVTNVNIGSILCDPANPVKNATLIRGRVVIFNLKMPITKGFPVVFHFQSITAPAVIKRLVCHLNRSSGEIVKNRPKCLVKNSSAVIEIEFERPICLELYKDYKDLGRFMLRYSGATIAAGMVEEILKTKEYQGGGGGGAAAAASN